MNNLAVLQEELIGGSAACLRGERARRSIETHALCEGLCVAVLVCGGRRGTASVQHADREEVRLALQLTDAALNAEPLEAIVASPRPQTVRKLLQYSATLGIARLNLIKTNRVVKSYLSSKRLEPECIQEDLLLGLEQSGSTQAPVVQIFRRFTPFIEDVLPARLQGGEKPLCLIADTRAAPRALPRLSDPAQPVVFAIGPESGWEDGEAAAFQTLGFVPVNLGPRVMRVETAFTWLTAQIQLLRQAG